MAKILDRLPISIRDDFTLVGSERVKLKANEIIVWVSLNMHQTRDPKPPVIRFPAILDTGLTHFFAIQEQHLRRWAALQPEVLRRLGYVRHSGKRVPLRAANLWLHRNIPGERDQLRDKPPQLLEINRGIAVFPDDAHFPRLPLLGLRTVLDNQLHVAIDGASKWVNLRTPDWRARLLRWLS